MKVNVRLIEGLTKGVISQVGFSRPCEHDPVETSQILYMPSGTIWFMGFLDDLATKSPVEKIFFDPGTIE